MLIYFSAYSFVLSDDALLDSTKQVHCWHNLFFMEGEPLGRGETGSGFELIFKLLFCLQRSVS